MSGCVLVSIVIDLLAKDVTDSESGLSIRFTRHLRETQSI